MPSVLGKDEEKGVGKPLYIITKILRALSLAERCVCMRVNTVMTSRSLRGLSYFIKAIENFSCVHIAR